MITATALSNLAGAGLGLLATSLQLVLSLSIASFVIKRGLDLLSALLSKKQPLSIWAEVKNKNIAVSLLGAAVVISYCNVIGTGLSSLSVVLQGLTNQSMLHTIMGVIGALINIGVATALASFAINLVFKIMDKLTTDIDEAAEFKAGNPAIGIIYFGIIVGVSFLVSAGVSSIGLSISNLLSACLGMVGI